MIDPITLAVQATYFEESFEGLDRAEAGLLELEAGTSDEVIGDVFRVIHSIKGGAGACGIDEITDLAHEMESALDDLRRGAHATPALSAILLRGVDELRNTLRARRAGAALTAPAHTGLCEALRAARPTPATSAAPATPLPDYVELAPDPATAASPPWSVEFTPHPALMQRGNDPLRILREAERLGGRATADLTRLPDLDALEPTELSLAWTLALPGTVARADVEELFAWVDGDCELTITQAAAAAELPAAPVAAAIAAPAAPVIADPAAAPAGAAATPPAPTAAATHGAANAAVASLRVSVEKIDLLMNMVGELVITQSMLGVIDDDKVIGAERIAQLREGLTQLARTTRSLQESVVQLRSTPIGAVFSRLPRLVHDVSARLGKEIALEVTGSSTELDKTVLERLGDPLVHIVRNSIDHGIEPAAARAAANKPAAGRIHVHAEHRGSAIVVFVEDDGGGLDHARILQVARERGVIAPDATPTAEEIERLIFAPGFSTAAQVSDVSGRGVGMDVVWRHVHELGGEVSISSTPGKGTRTTLRLPLTLAIVEGQLIRLGDCHYVIPLLSIVESTELDPNRLSRPAGQSDIYRIRDQIVPVCDLAVALGLCPAPQRSNLLVIVEADGQPFGLLVDELLGQQQVVIKSLEAHYGRVEGLAGATVLGDGSVAFIVDVADLARNARRRAA